MQIKLDIMSNWLKQSGLKVNESKIELCLFTKKDTPQVEITINNVSVKSGTTMHVLGVFFYSKISWAKQV